MDARTRNLIDDADLSRAEIIARASGERAGKTNWTVLAIYRTPNLPGLFTAEIVGETTQAGQVRRVRRMGFPTLAKALNWSAFDHGSALYEELRQKVLSFLSGGIVADGKAADYLVPVPIVHEARAIKAVEIGEGPGRKRVEFAEKAAVQRSGFDGKGGLLGAIEWLYEGIDLGEGETAAADAFAADFGLDRTSVGAGIFSYGIGFRHGGYDLTGWKAFIASLAFFDREAFHANRGTGRAD